MMKDSLYPNVRIKNQSSIKKGVGQIVKHISYDEEYQRLIALLTPHEYYNPPSTIIKRWNDAVFGETAVALWHKRLGLY